MVKILAIFDRQIEAYGAGPAMPLFRHLSLTPQMGEEFPHFRDLLAPMAQLSYRMSGTQITAPPPDTPPDEALPPWLQASDSISYVSFRRSSMEGQDSGQHGVRLLRMEQGFRYASIYAHANSA